MSRQQIVVVDPDAPRVHIVGHQGDLFRRALLHPGSHVILLWHTPHIHTHTHARIQRKRHIVGRSSHPAMNGCATHFHAHDQKSHIYQKLFSVSVLRNEAEEIRHLETTYMEKCFHFRGLTGVFSRDRLRAQQTSFLLL